MDPINPLTQGIEKSASAYRIVKEDLEYQLGCLERGVDSDILAKIDVLKNIISWIQDELNELEEEKYK